MARLPYTQEKILSDVLRSAVAEFVAAKDRFNVDGSAYIPGGWFDRIRRRVRGRPVTAATSSALLAWVIP